MDKQIYLTRGWEDRNHKGVLFTGRKEGQLVREELSLNQKDYDEYRYEIIMPDETSSFESSFYLGLLFDSVKKLGWDKFAQKYRFNLDSLSDSDRMYVRAQLDSCERQAKHELTGKSREC